MKYVAVASSTLCDAGYMVCRISPGRLFVKKLRLYIFYINVTPIFSALSDTTVLNPLVLVKYQCCCGTMLSILLEALRG
jgi:hypothetical protein